MTALRGYRPRISATTPLTVDESFALVASGEAMTLGPGHGPHDVAGGHRAPPDGRPPALRDAHAPAAGEERPATLAFVRHVLATYRVEPTTGQLERLVR